MINNPNDIGFIHDIAGLDKLRQKALNGDQNAEQSALTAAARQFESIFTSMMLKSMRDANSDFKSDLMSSQNEDLYRQMLDEQMASEFSSSGSLGLADMIVAQLSTGQTASEQKGEDGFQEAMRRVEHARKTASERSNEDLVAAVYPLRKTQAVQSTQFDSRHSFVTKLKPYADKAARMLGVDSSLLIAQAALETGWGQKMVKNAVATAITSLISKRIAAGRVIKSRPKPWNITTMFRLSKKPHSDLMPALMIALTIMSVSWKTTRVTPMRWIMGGAVNALSTVSTALGTRQTLNTPTRYCV